MASKRRSDGEAGYVQAAKRARIAPHGLPHFHEDSEQQNLNASRLNMQQMPQQSPVVTANAQPFDQAEEIRNINAMRLAMQGGSRHSPVPVMNCQTNSGPSIKEEPEDSEFVGLTANHNGTPGPFLGAHTSLSAHGKRHAHSLPPSDAQKAAKIRTAADLLKQYDLADDFSQIAIKTLREVCLSTHDAQVWTVRHRLIEHGVPEAKADEVAAMLRPQSLQSVPLEQVAPSLTDTGCLDVVLGILQDGAPSDEIKAHLFSCRSAIRDQWQSGNGEYDRLTRSQAPDPELVTSVSGRGREESATMSGGLGGPSNAAEDARHHSTFMQEEISENGDDFIRDTADPAKRHRIEKFRTRFPRDIDLYLFHVKMAHKASVELKRLRLHHCTKVAAEYFKTMPAVQRQEWNDFHGRLLEDDSSPFDIPAGTEMLGRHGCFDRLQEEIRPDLSGISNIMPAQGLNFDPSHQSDMMAPTLIWYRSIIRNAETFKRVAFIVNTPERPTCDSDLEAFKAACAQTYQQSIDLDLTEQSSRYLWHTVFHQREEEDLVFKHWRPIKVGGVRLFPERLPERQKKKFHCDLYDADISEQEVAQRISAAFANLSPGSGEALLYEAPKLYKYGNNQYYVWVPIKNEADWLLRFYVPLILESGGVHVACFRHTRNIDACPYCQIRHAAPCHQAPVVDLPLSLHLLPGATNHTTSRSKGVTADNPPPETAAAGISNVHTAEQVRVRFSNRRSLFLHHLFEACKAAGIPTDRTDYNARALGFWRSCDRDHKKNWSRLLKSLSNGEVDAFKLNAAAEPLLSEHGLPGAMAPVTGDEIASDTSMHSDAGESDPEETSRSEEGDLEEAESGLAVDGEDSNASELDGLNESDRESVSLKHEGDPDDRISTTTTSTQPSATPMIEDFRMIRHAASKPPSETYEGAVVYPKRRDNQFLLAFNIRTPECPILELTKKEFNKVCAARFGGNFKPIFIPAQSQIFTVRLKSREAVQDALLANTTLQIGDFPVYAEPFPANPPRLLLCDFLGQTVPEEQLAYAISNMFFDLNCGITLLKYPGSVYLIRLSRSIRLFRVYVKFSLSETETCIARFQPVSNIKASPCPVCHGQHSWPCPKAAIVPLPQIARQEGGNADSRMSRS